LRAIRAGRCRPRERRYADHIFIQIYFRMHHFVAKKIFFASGGKRALTPPNQNPADVPAAASISKEEALLRQTDRATQCTSRNFANKP